MYLWLFLQIYLCDFRLLLCSRVTWMCALEMDWHAAFTDYHENQHQWFANVFLFAPEASSNKVKQRNFSAFILNA